MFTPKHIVVLVVCIALIVGLLFFTKKWSLDAKYKAFLGVALVSETVKVFFYILYWEDSYHGVLPREDLPFHLCSLQIIFTLVYVFSKNERLKRTLAAFMMPSGLVGGAAAILIPASPSLDEWVITLQYFVYHAALIALAVSILISKEIKFTVKDYGSCILFIFALMFFSFYLNGILYDINDLREPNFMYVVSPPQPGLPYLTEDYGWGVYIAHYAILIFTVVTLFYIKPIIVGVKEWAAKRKLPKEAPTQV